MRLRISLTVGLGVLALTVTSGPNALASVPDQPMSAVNQDAARTAEVGVDRASSCYSHTGHDSGTGVLSQNFTDSADSRYDAQGADDFTLGSACRVRRAVVIGDLFKGNGPARSETVTFYTNRLNAPGTVITRATIKGRVSAGGTYTINLKQPVTLSKGRHWISVQVNMDGDVGEWSWNTSTTQSGIKATWVNPGSGFHTGCTTYRTMQQCIGDSGEGPDFEFTLSR